MCAKRVAGRYCRRKKAAKAAAFWNNKAVYFPAYWRTQSTK
ncbi:hypothetical protein GJA_2216 [Janthinobacterium agaricidamnosum NBRC 102515 = DSM 9628]|uniref:Uncharacterized protein n=1 Tax=Janthinobacterium agaricidamnosum NBRC 102515 = DSM 9628 TaxID=1349767 RepID=W0V5G3_9BURK|nr:hypothetical protein GJA_2216 [Janthinobacterium agaricidamnosum NBRC 102515 = DSM 9628]